VEDQHLAVGVGPRTDAMVGTSSASVTVRATDRDPLQDDGEAAGRLERLGGVEEDWRRPRSCLDR